MQSKNIIPSKQILDSIFYCLMIGLGVYFWNFPEIPTKGWHNVCMMIIAASNYLQAVVGIIVWLIMYRYYHTNPDKIRRIAYKQFYIDGKTPKWRMAETFADTLVFFIFFLGVDKFHIMAVSFLVMRFGKFVISMTAAKILTLRQPINS